MACGLTPELARMLGQMGAEKEREAAAAQRALEEATRARERGEQASNSSNDKSSPATADAYDWTRAYGKWTGWEDPEELARREQEARARSERAARQAQLGGCDHDHSAEQRLMDMATREKQRACDEFRRLGNAFFAQGQFQRAGFHYHQALVYFEYMFPDSEAETAAMDSLRSRVLLNMAACRLKTQHLEDAAQHADQALEIDPHSVKALFRRAQARRLRDEFALAEADLERALELAEGGPAGVLAALAQERALLRAKVLAYKLRSREVSAAMFGGGKSASSGAGSSSGRGAALALDARVMDLQLASTDTDKSEEIAFESCRPSTTGLAALEALVASK